MRLLTSTLALFCLLLAACGDSTSETATEGLPEQPATDEATAPTLADEPGAAADTTKLKVVGGTEATEAVE